MTREDIRQAILDIIGDIAPDEDLTGIKDEIRLREQLDLDSMDFLDIVMELRKRYGVEVPEAEYMELASLSSSVKYLEPKLKDK
jgi:acyl carrier protein